MCYFMELFLNLSVFTLWPVWDCELAKTALGDKAFCLRHGLLYTTWVEISLVDAMWIDHHAERAGMVIVPLLFLPLL